jgi:DNA polymerase V
MYALVDCNNFYCSCERLFNPKLENRPVIVLSNNDGCAIARSEEAKSLGIAMATPAFLIEDLIRKNNVAVFSSNYTLYGDISDRVMQTIGSFVPRMEIYSIDETFLDLDYMPHTDLLQLGLTIRKTIRQNIGIPVTVGIAPTKTLAKMANRYAKKRKKNLGVFWAANTDLVNEMLSDTEVSEICGIGHQYALFLRRHGIYTALDLSKAPDEWVRVNMSVVGQRLLNELRGVPAIQWEFERPSKKNICTSRSFGNLLTDRNIINEAICNHAAACAYKLRKQKSCCRVVNVFIHTNPHKTEEPQYSRSINLELETASNNTAEIIKYASKGFNMIFKEGFQYMKCGVVVNDLLPEDQIQHSMYDRQNRTKGKTVMNALDRINLSLGKEVLRFAVQGYEKKYRLKAEWLSPRYTTNINDIIKVRI